MNEKRIPYSNSPKDCKLQPLAHTSAKQPSVAHRHSTASSLVCHAAGSMLHYILVAYNEDHWWLLANETEHHMQCSSTNSKPSLMSWQN